MFDYKNASPKDALQQIKEIANATGAMSAFVGKEYKAIPEILDNNEQIHALTSGTFGTETSHTNSSHTGVIILSDKRIILFDKGMFFGTTLISLPFSKINTISYNTHIMTSTIYVESSHATYELTNIAKQSAPIFVEKALRIMDELENNKYNNNQNQPAQTEEDKYAKLEKIAELLEKGILTQEEFTMEKSKILNS